jgi:hypothetical protein
MALVILLLHFVALCVKLDPHTCKCIHSVLLLKLGVTLYFYMRNIEESCHTCRYIWIYYIIFHIWKWVRFLFVWNLIPTRKCIHSVLLLKLGVKLYFSTRNIEESCHTRRYIWIYYIRFHIWKWVRFLFVLCSQLKRLQAMSIKAGTCVLLSFWFSFCIFPALLGLILVSCWHFPSFEQLVDAWI